MKIPCARCRASLPQLLDEYGRIRPYSGASADVRAHLASCAECAREWNILCNVQAQTRAIGLAPAPPQLRLNVRAALERETQPAPRAESWFALRRPAFAWSSGAVLAAFALILSMRAPQPSLESPTVTNQKEIAAAGPDKDETSSGAVADGKISRAAKLPPKLGRAAPAASPSKPLAAQKLNGAPKTDAAPFSSPARVPAIVPPSPVPPVIAARKPVRRDNQTPRPGTASNTVAAQSGALKPRAAPIAPQAKLDARRAAPLPGRPAAIALGAGSRAASAPSRVMKNADATRPESRALSEATPMRVRLSLLPRATENERGRFPAMRGGGSENASNGGRNQADGSESSAADRRDEIAARSNVNAPDDAPAASFAKRAAPAAAPATPPAESAQDSQRAVAGRLEALESRESTAVAASPESRQRTGATTYSAPFSLAQPSGSLAANETRRALLVVTPPRDLKNVRLCVTRDGLQLGETDTIWRGDARRGRDIVVPVSLRASRSGTVRAVVSLETPDGTILASQTVEVFVTQ